jgi:hypothetical protein
MALDNLMELSDLCGMGFVNVHHLLSLSFH